MRACAPLTVEVPRDLAWPLFVATLAATAASGVAAWLVQVGAQATAFGPAVAVAAFCCTVLALPAAAMPPRRLRWDGQRWYVGGPGGLDEQAGEVRVMLDLSFMMLLRFEAEGGSWLWPTCWLAVRRQRLAAPWGDLRRTVYSAPPLLGGMSSGDGPHTETTRPD